MSSIKNNFWFWPGFLVGLFYFGWIFRWIWANYPLDQFGIENKIAAFIIVSVIFLTSTAVMALWWGIATYTGSKLVKNKVNLLTPLVLASIFTLAEYFRSVFFSIFWYGSGGTIGPYWPLGNPAYLFININPLALSASWWGIYGIDFWFVLFFSSLALLIFQRRYAKIYLLTLGVVLITLAIVNYSSNIFLKNINQSPAIPVAVIQTNKPSQRPDFPENNLEDFKVKLELLEEASGTIKNGLVVFPEGAAFTKNLANFLDGYDLESYFKNLSSEELLIIDNVRISEDKKFRSKALFISSKDGIIGTYNKQILSPGGEYLPYLIKLPLVLLSQNLVNQFQRFNEFNPDNESNLVSYKNKPLSILICSEFKSPQKARKNIGDFIIITGSFSSFRGASSLVNQDQTSARFRAIENAKYIALASNAGQSYIINPAGKIEKITNPNSYELLTGVIVPNHNRTWYNYMGDWPILLISLAILGLGIRKQVRSD